MQILVHHRRKQQSPAARVQRFCLRRNNHRRNYAATNQAHLQRRKRCRAPQTPTQTYPHHHHIKQKIATGRGCRLHPNHQRRKHAGTGRAQPPSQGDAITLWIPPGRRFCSRLLRRHHLSPSPVPQRDTKVAKALRPTSTMRKRLNPQPKHFIPTTRLPPQQPPKPSQSAARSDMSPVLPMIKSPPEARPTPTKQPWAGTNSVLAASARGNPRAKLLMWGPRQPLPWTNAIRMAQRSSYRHLFSVWVPSVGPAHVHEEGGRGKPRSRREKCYSGQPPALGIASDS